MEEILKRRYPMDAMVGDIVSSAVDIAVEEYCNLPGEIFEIWDFLPEEFLDETEERYINALGMSAETCCQNGLYQFSCVQYHMLFMTAVYYMLLKVSVLCLEEFDKALYFLLKDRFSDFRGEGNTKNGQLYFGSFAIINESDVFMLFRVVGLDGSLLGELKNLVKKRNQYAHANGQLLLTSDELFTEELNNYNALIQRVDSLLKTKMTEFYIQTITDKDFYDPEIREYLDPREQIVQLFIKKYSLSVNELNWIRKVKLSRFDGLDGEDDIKSLHVELMQYYKDKTRDE